MRLKNLLHPFRLSAYWADFSAYRQAAKASGTWMPKLRDMRAILDEATKETSFDTQYVYHTGWATRMLAMAPPERHVDISSSIWFVGMASAICPIAHYDYRPPAIGLPNVTVGHADLIKLPFADGSLPSVSCMHVVEHVGLGRYGDAIDAEGDRKAMAELARVVAPGGLLLFVVPAGRPRIVFNAHRIYGYQDVVDRFPGFVVENFALITDRRNGSQMIFDADPALVADQRYGCGCWALRKAA